MTDKYEQLYKGLTEIINMSNDDNLKGVVADFEKMTIGEIEEEAKPKYTNEDFNKMSYKERLVLSNDEPETYNQLTGGK